MNFIQCKYDKYFEFQIVAIEYFLENMDATEVNWEPILEMLPTQDLDDYDERMK